MDKVFSVEAKGSKGQWINFSLPQTTYGMLDLLDKIGCPMDANPPEVEAYSSEDIKYMSLGSLVSEGRLNLYELNALASKLASMDDTQRMIFDGLVKVETEKKKDPIPLDKLIDLAYSVDWCHVVPDVHNDAQLGRFYAENGFLPETKELPESLYEILDFEFLGRRARINEGGIFTADGYVMKDSEPKEVPSSIDLKPHKPEYAILLDVTHAGRSAQLPLPSSPQTMDAALDAIGARDWDGVSLRCLDCRAPALIPTIGERDNIAHINRLAEMLEQMNDEQLTRFKAVLDATENYSVLGATHIATTLDDYLFSPQYTTAEDVAMDCILSSMGRAAASQLYPFVQLEQYGKVLMESQECALTDYGMVSREDGQCLKTSLSPTGPVQGGMEMM